MFRSNLSHLLELMGSGKESLIFMKKRTRRFTAQWTKAAKYLAQKLGDIRRDQKQVCYPFRECLDTVLTALGLQAWGSSWCEAPGGRGHEVQVDTVLSRHEPVVSNRHRVSGGHR